jgi:choline dehydrogenase-like flavoprotein
MYPRGPNTNNNDKQGGYHIGDVVDRRLRVVGVNRLRGADAGVMPDVTSGNANAPTIMTGEEAAEMIAAENGVKLATFVDEGR